MIAPAKMLVIDLYFFYSFPSLFFMPSILKFPSRKHMQNQLDKVHTKFTVEHWSLAYIFHDSHILFFLASSKPTKLQLVIYWEFSIGLEVILRVFCTFIIFFPDLILYINLTEFIYIVYISQWRGLILYICITLNDVLK